MIRKRLFNLIAGNESNTLLQNFKSFRPWHSEVIEKNYLKRKKLPKKQKSYSKRIKVTQNDKKLPKTNELVKTKKKQ
jgi:hypothetical protein